MKRTIKLALAASMILGATSAMATNGTNLIGYGAKSRAMGGTGISNFNGAESAFANPALIAKSKSNTEITIGATLLMPDVSFSADAAANGALTGGAITTASDDSSTAGDGMIPSVAVINKVDDSLAWGMALYGVGGMGVDYRTAAPSSAITAGSTNDNLLLMRMSIPIAYTIEGVSLAIAPVLEYGALAISTMDGATPLGSTTDIATGFEVGVAYEIAGLSLGLDYKSAVTHDFVGSFSSTNPTTGATQTELDTPSVLGLGVSYAMGEHTVAVDYKTIGYSSAAGFEDFGWEDQTVIALGYEYQADGWAARVGYNTGSSPLPTTITDAASFGQVAGSMMMFPAVCESHMTFGGTYDASKTMSIDLAYMIASGSASSTMPAAFGGGTIEAVNDQTSLSFAVNYAF